MTNRIAGSMLTNSTLNDINSALGAMERSSNELSSGKTILESSSNPYGASRTIDLQSQLDGLSSYTAGISDGITWTQTANGAMANIKEMTERVRELVLEASNGTNNQGDLANIAIEVTQLTESIKQDADTQYGGQYVFAGTATSTPPYAQGENDEFNGNTEAVSRAIGPNTSVTISSNLSEVLGNGQASGDGKLLDVLRTISEHLKEGTTESREALSSTDLKALDGSLETLSDAQSITGSATDQLQMAVTRIEALEVSISKTLSDTDATDIAKTTIAFSNQPAASEAAL